MSAPLDQFVSIADDLSLHGHKFIFFIDFLQQRFEVIEERSLTNHPDILIDFQGYKNFIFNKKSDVANQIQFRVSPEPYKSYKSKFDRIQQALLDNKIEVINFTRCTPISTNVSLKELFHYSEAKYKVFYRDQWISFSPETFVRICNGKLFTYPMKGTINAELPGAETRLLNDKKELEEHQKTNAILIKDLEEVAENITVSHFRQLSLIRTNRKNLWTTSSEITGDVKPQISNKIGTLLSKLLPAGSVTGYPKNTSLEIIKDVEGYERGYYCGICGYFDGHNLDSGVLIRFIQQEGDQLFFKSGGGITSKSIAETEYQEVINKIYVPVY